MPPRRGRAVAGSRAGGAGWPEASSSEGAPIGSLGASPSIATVGGLSAGVVRLVDWRPGGNPAPSGRRPRLSARYEGNPDPTAGLITSSSASFRVHPTLSMSVVSIRVSKINCDRLRSGAPIGEDAGQVPSTAGRTLRAGWRSRLRNRSCTRSAQLAGGTFLAPGGASGAGIIRAGRCAPGRGAAGYKPEELESQERNMSQRPVYGCAGRPGAQGLTPGPAGPIGTGGERDDGAGDLASEHQ